MRAKSIINVRRSSICWRGRRTDNGRQKTRNHGYDVIVGGKLLLITQITSQTCHAQTQNSNQQAPSLPASFHVGGMPTASSLAWKTSLEKSGRCGIAAD